MIRLDDDHFRMIFHKIFSSYLEKTFGFSTHRAENIAPQLINKPVNVTFGDRRHIYWFALVAMSDTRTTSATLYPRFASMFNRNTSLYTVGEVPSRAKMSSLFRRYQIALPEYQIDFFLERKRHLDSLFAGDPLEIYKDVATIDELMEKLHALKKKHGIKNIFPGAKRKVFTLLAMFLSEFTQFEFSEIVPVDVWVQNIANTTNALTGNGVVDINTLEQMIRPVLTDVFEEFRAYDGISSATWILGSRFCSNCHRTDMSQTCPIFEDCGGPSLRMRHPESGKLYGRIERPYKPRGKFRTSKAPA